MHSGWFGSGCQWRLKPQPEWHSVLDWKSGSVSWQLKSPVESGGGLWNQSWSRWILEFFFTDLDYVDEESWRILER